MFDDGYTLLQHVPARDPDYPEFWFEYRPMLSRERRRLHGLLGRRDRETAEQIGAAAVLSHVTWLSFSASPANIASDLVRQLEFWRPLVETVIGLTRAEQEAWDTRNLSEGVELELAYPLIAARSCEDCGKWLYDPDTHRIVTRGGKPCARPSAAMTPCKLPAGHCPKGTPEDQRSLSERNQQMYVFFQECRAVGRFPDDPLVLDRTRLIDLAERHAAQRQQEAQGE